MVSALGHSIILRIKDFLYMIGYLGKLITASFFFATRGKTARKILTMQLLFTYPCSGLRLTQQCTAVS